MTEAHLRASWEELLTNAACRFGTPCYVVRWRPILEALARLGEITADGLRVRSWLSLKTHPVPPLVRQWLQTGRGVEVVSEREFVMADHLGASVDELLVNGVAKHTWLRDYARPGLRVHFDSFSEVTACLPTATAAKWRLGVRCHVPDERDARDPRFGGQFGMTACEAVSSLKTLIEGGCDVQGIHFHLGQKPQRATAFARSVEYVARVCAKARFAPRYLDLGGGLPTGLAAADALRGLEAAIATARLAFGSTLEEIWLENGRFVTEASTALIVRVLDVKERKDSRYLICDGGRTNQALAADRGMQPVLILPARRGRPQLTTICGPTCMTDDTLGRITLPSDIAAGDVIAWMHAGAYHLPWETRFSHGLCAVAWCDGGERMSLARKQESPTGWADQWVPTAA